MNIIFDANEHLIFYGAMVPECCQFMKYQLLIRYVRIFADAWKRLMLGAMYVTINRNISRFLRITFIVMRFPFVILNSSGG